MRVDFSNKELCIRCGKITEYEINTPTEARQYYVDGSGQLCPECWRKVYRRCTPDEGEFDHTLIE